MSFSLPQNNDSGNDHAGVRCITFISSDTLGFTSFPPELLARIEAVVNTSWYKGIQRSTSDGHGKRNAYHMKCLGNPWSTLFARSTFGVIKSCRLLLGLARLLVSEGWDVELSMIGKGWGSKHSSWFLTQAMGNAERHPAMCCIAFGRSDTLRVIEGSSEVVEAVQFTITDYWVRGLQERKSYGNTEEFKFRGNPWRVGGFDADVFLSQLILALTSVGWNVFATVEFQYNQEYELAILTRWILRRQSGGSAGR